MTSGTILSASQAASILLSAGIGPNDDIGDGFDFIQGQNKYWIMQTGTRFASATGASPDGWHIVYQPSADELLAGTPAPDFLDKLSTALQGGVLGAANLFQNAGVILTVVILAVAGVFIWQQSQKK